MTGGYLDPLLVAIYSSGYHQRMDTGNKNSLPEKQEHIFSLKIGKDLYENVLKDSNEHLFVEGWMERTAENDDELTIDFKIKTREQALRFLSYMVKLPVVNRVKALSDTLGAIYRREDRISAGEDPDTLNLKEDDLGMSESKRFLPLVLSEAFQAVKNFASTTNDAEVSAMCRGIGGGLAVRGNELEGWDRTLSRPEFSGAWVFAIDSLTDSGFVAAAGAGLNKQGRGVLSQNNTKVTDDTCRLPCFLVAPLGVEDPKKGQAETQLLFTAALLSVYAEDQKNGGRLLREMKQEYARYHTEQKPSIDYQATFEDFAEGGAQMAEFERNPLDWARNNQMFCTYIGDFLEWTGGHSDFPCFIQKGQTGRQHLSGYPPKVMTKMRELAKDPRSGFAYFEPEAKGENSSYLDEVVKSLEGRRTEAQRESFGKKREEWIGEIKKGSPDFLNLIMGEGVMTKDGKEVTVVDNNSGEVTEEGVDELVRTLGPAIDPEENGLQNGERERVEKTLKSLMQFRKSLEAQGIHVELGKISSISDFSKFLLEKNRQRKEEGASLENLDKVLKQYKKPDQSPLEKHQSLEDLCNAVTQVLSEELQDLGEEERKILRELVFNGAKTEQVYGMMRFPDGTLKFGKANDYSLRVVDLVRDGGTFAPFVVWVSKGLAVGDWDTSLLQQVASNNAFLKGLVGVQPAPKRTAEQTENGGRDGWDEMIRAFGYKNDKAVPDNFIDFVVGCVNNFIETKRGGDPDVPDLDEIAMGSEDDVQKRLERLFGAGWQYKKALPQVASLLCTWRAFNSDKSGTIGPVAMRDAANNALIGIGLIQAGVGDDKKYKKILGELTQEAKDNDGKLGVTPENRARFYQYRRQYGSYQIEHMIHEHLEPYRIPETEMFPGLGVICVAVINRLDEILPPHLKHSKKMIIPAEEVQRVAREAESPVSLPLTMFAPDAKKRQFCETLKKGLTVSALRKIIDPDNKLPPIPKKGAEDELGENEKELFHYVLFGEKNPDHKKQVWQYIRGAKNSTEGKEKLYSIIATGLRIEEFSDQPVKGGLPELGLRIHEIFTNGGGYGGFGQARWGKIVEHGTNLDREAGRRTAEMPMKKDENKLPKNDLPAEMRSHKEVKTALSLREKKNNEETRKEARKIIAEKILEKIKTTEGVPLIPADYKAKIINRLVLWGCLPVGGGSKEENSLQEKCGPKDENRCIGADKFGGMCRSGEVWLIFNAVQRTNFSEQEEVALKILAEVGARGVEELSESKEKEEGGACLKSVNRLHARGAGGARVTLMSR